MNTLTKNKPLLLTVVGLAIMAQSVLWEYVRVRPDYRFVIEPWSLRGYEVDQGLVIALGAVVIAAVALLMAFGVIKETLLHSAIVVGALVLFGVVAALVTDAKDVKIPFVIHVGLAAILATVARSLIGDRLPEDWNKRDRAARSGIWLVAFLVALFGVIGPLLQNEQPFWIFLAVGGLVIGAFSMFRHPKELSGWRMIINGILAIWILSMTMSASLRVSLEEVQFAANSVAADTQDLQITSGVLLAWFGGLVAFAGAVGMWAKRRDEIAAHERARKQQEAARESEAQLSSTG